VARAPEILEFPGFQECRGYLDSVNLAFRATPAFLASQAFRAAVFLGCRVHQGFLAECQGFLAAPRVVRVTRVLLECPALQQSHNSPRSVQTRLWRRKNFYSRLIS
jgi:hypothetical protein